MKKSLFIIYFLITSILNCRLPLFKKYPKLKENISHISLCNLPTPISKARNFSKKIGVKNLFIKRDDLTGRIDKEIQLYGGNKPRKLEFILADALKNNAKTIITFGCVGSNHCLATAVYAKLLGLKCILMLKHQANSAVVRNNLLLDNYNNAILKLFQTNQERNSFRDNLLKADSNSYFIPTGASNEIGTMGFVNAMLELSEQIKSKKIKEPDLIYLPVGSCGTIAGLLLGLKISKLKSKIVAVCVQPESEHAEFYNKIKELFSQTNKLLNSFELTIPIYDFPESNLILNKKFCGPDYGVPIAEALQAIKLFEETENIKLEATYSAKAVAALMDDAMHNEINKKTILFWNTYCGIDFSHLIKFDDYKILPSDFHKYFEGKA